MSEVDILTTLEFNLQSQKDSNGAGLFAQAAQRHDKMAFLKNLYAELGKGNSVLKTGRASGGFGKSFNPSQVNRAMQQLWEDALSGYAERNISDINPAKLLEIANIYKESGAKKDYGRTIDENYHKAALCYALAANAQFVKKALSEEDKRAICQAYQELAGLYRHEKEDQHSWLMPNEEIAKEMLSAKEKFMNTHGLVLMADAGVLEGKEMVVRTDPKKAPFDRLCCDIYSAIDEYRAQIGAVKQSDDADIGARSDQKAQRCLAMNQIELAIDDLQRQAQTGRMVYEDALHYLLYGVLTLKTMEIEKKHFSQAPSFWYKIFGKPSTLGESLRGLLTDREIVIRESEGSIKPNATVLTDAQQAYQMLLERLDRVTKEAIEANKVEGREIHVQRLSHRSAFSK